MNIGNDGKVTKRRRSEDFDYHQRNDLASKESKDMFARVQRTEAMTKDGKIFCAGSRHDQLFVIIVTKLIWM